MLEHLTLDAGPYAMKMHVRALEPGCLIDVDPERYARELALKTGILSSDYGYYYQALPGTEDMQWETLEVVLPNMAQHYPRWFELDLEGDRWRWTNRLLATQTVFKIGDAATLPLPPLDWLGRQVQEDLCVMDGNTPDTPLVAGHLCFGSGWCLDDKLGAAFGAIHAPVPGFEASIGRSAGLMMQRLRTDRPTARANWTIHPSDRLNCAPALKRQYAFEHAATLECGQCRRALFPALGMADVRQVPAHEGRAVHDPYAREITGGGVHESRGRPPPGSLAARHAGRARRL